MRNLLHPVFVISCFLWVVIRLGRLSHHPIPYLNGQLTDFLAVPAIGHLCLTFIRTLVVKDPHYVFPLSFVLFIALYISVAFELVLPSWSDKFVGDWLDVMAYFAGSLFYYKCQRLFIPGK